MLLGFRFYWKKEGNEIRRAEVTGRMGGLVVDGGGLFWRMDEVDN